jgi:curli production assembly/transport component CsgE
MLSRPFTSHPGYRSAGGGVGLLLLLLLGSQASWAQRPQPARKIALPTSADKKELSPKQVDEALRLFLRADSLQQALRAQPGMEADAEGFVLDQTLTKPGHEFYELFYSSLQAITGLGDYTITLSERPIRGTSSLISMNVNDTELLEMPLPTRTEQIEEAVTAAVETASGFLTEQQALSTQMETVHPTSPTSPTPAPAPAKPPRR